MKQEASLQSACVKWFSLQYPQFRGLCIHVPNGGSRKNAIEGRNMKMQGVTPGVADLLLLLPRKGYGCLCIEMKTQKGRQSPNQKFWEEQTEKHGNLYVVCRSIEEFIGTINSYLDEKIIESNEGYYIAFDYAPRIVDDIKLIPGRKFDHLQKRWHVPGSSRQHLFNFARRHGFDMPGEKIKMFENFNYSIPEMPKHTGDLSFLKRELYDFQKDGVAYALNKKKALIGDQPGLGKAQPIDSKIATPIGWIKMGNVEVGDSIFGSDGMVYNVDNVYPQGIRPIYKVVFNDGVSTECDIDHLWSVRDINRRKRDTGWITKSTRELIEIGVEWKASNKRNETGRNPVLKWEIPLTQPVKYKEKKYIIHPYIMGMLLGDGCLSGKDRRPILISIPDFEKESVNRISKLLPNNIKLKRNDKPACPQYAITQTNTTSKNPIKEEIKRLELNTTGIHKFIPAEYLHGSINQRISLLQGLMDSDGSAKKNRITFHTCAEGLVDGITELVQSLGGCVIVRKYDRTKEGKRNEWQINIRIDICPFQIERKKAQWKKCDFRRYIKSIEYIGDKEAICIKVSAPNHLYLTDNFIVTHNTAQAIAAITEANAFPCLIITPASLKINWQREIEMWTHKDAMILTDSIKNTWPYFSECGMSQFFITNYESLKKYFVAEVNQPIGEDGKKKPLSLKHIKFRENIKTFKSVIVDESHRTKDIKTLQTKLTKGLCKGKEFIFLLTGTPVVNKPNDLLTQLLILEQIDKFGGNSKEFKKIFCEKDEHWKELNVLLRRNCFYRREKTDVLKQLPAKVRQSVLCDITSRREYNDAMNDLEQYLKRYRQATDEQIQKSMKGEIMVRIGVLKNISARGKLRDVIDYVSDVVDAGEKIILFVHLKEVAETLKKFFPAAVSITGSDDSQTRQRNIDAFQKNPQIQVIICSIKAAGVGITLTASSRVAFVELPWHPADCEQCEDRAHRIGQIDSVQCTYFLGKDTIDEWIYQIIDEKRSMTRQITGARDYVEESVMNGIIDLLNKGK